MHWFYWYAKRAKQILKSDRPLVPSGSNKQVVTSLREVAANKVYFDVMSHKCRSNNKSLRISINRPVSV
ncbi:MAG: DNA-directed RNA polymerase subunit omega [Bdellovibrionales bacterium]